MNWVFYHVIDIAEQILLFNDQCLMFTKFALGFKSDEA